MLGQRVADLIDLQAAENNGPESDIESEEEYPSQAPATVETPKGKAPTVASLSKTLRKRGKKTPEELQAAATEKEEKRRAAKARKGKKDQDAPVQAPTTRPKPRPKAKSAAIVIDSDIEDVTEQRSLTPAADAAGSVLPAVQPVVPAASADAMDIDEPAALQHHLTSPSSPRPPSRALSSPSPAPADIRMASPPHPPASTPIPTVPVPPTPSRPAVPSPSVRGTTPVMSPWPRPLASPARATEPAPTVPAVTAQFTQASLSLPDPAPGLQTIPELDVDSDMADPDTNQEPDLFTPLSQLTHLSCE